MKKIVNPSRKQIEKYLDVIGWSLRHRGCEHYYFYNHRKVCTGMCLLYPNSTDARITFDNKSYRFPSFTFYLNNCIMEILDPDNNPAVAFYGKDNKSIFILCPNYDRKRKERNNVQMANRTNHKTKQS